MKTLEEILQKFGYNGEALGISVEPIIRGLDEISNVNY